METSQILKGLTSEHIMQASLPGKGLFTKVPKKTLGTEMRYCLPAISSHSLGRVAAGHDIQAKLQAAAAHHICGIEIMYEDVHELASRSPGGPTPANLLAAASNIQNLADSLSLTITSLQPFANYEGLVSRTAHAAAIEKAKLWLRLAQALRTNCILIPSNFLPATECTSDLTTIVEDMTELADLGAKENPPISFAFENLCWSTHIDTWEGVHAVVSAVDRWNFGYCLDTFNIAGRVYGDPTSADGKTECAEVAMLRSLERMVECVDREKIFFIQIVDAERLSPPLSVEHPWYNASQPMRMTWSRNARLFAFEESKGGYLPILNVCKALLEDLGYRGWVSFELFSRTLYETGAEVPQEHATRAKRSWNKLVEAFPEILYDETVELPKERAKTAGISGKNCEDTTTNFLMAGALMEGTTEGTSTNAFSFLHINVAKKRCQIGIGATGALLLAYRRLLLLLYSPGEARVDSNNLQCLLAGHA